MMGVFVIFQDSPLEMKDITFGLRCPASIVHTVISALQGRNDGIKFYRMYQTLSSYALERREVDWEDTSRFPIIARSGTEVFGHIKYPTRSQ